MAQRGIQLLRTDDSVSGVVKFYDRRVEDAQRAFVGEVSVSNMIVEALNAAGIGNKLTNEQIEQLGVNLAPVIRAAVHGITQNILDSSNKLDGDERRDYVRKMCAVVQSGGWASAPQDESALRKRAIDALVKMGLTLQAATAAVDGAKSA